MIKRKNLLLKMMTQNYNINLSSNEADIRLVPMVTKVVIPLSDLNLQNRLMGQFVVDQEEPSSSITPPQSNVELVTPTPFILPAKRPTILAPKVTNTRSISSLFPPSDTILEIEDFGKHYKTTLLAHYDTQHSSFEEAAECVSIVFSELDKLLGDKPIRYYQRLYKLPDARSGGYLLEPKLFVV